MIVREKYNESYINSKETFAEITNSIICAEEQIDYLLSLVEKTKFPKRKSTDRDTNTYLN